MTPEPERERIEEIVQIFQHEYGQYTSLEALSIASDWLRNTLHQELQKVRHDWLREEIVKLEGMKNRRYYEDITHADEDLKLIQARSMELGHSSAIKTIIDRYQSELDQPIS